jgi:hypothetical protein
VEFKEDWAKIIHLDGTKYFVSGGSQDDLSNPKYSKKAFILDSASGLIEKLPNMKWKR